MIEAEKQAETARILDRLEREGSLDLEAAEFYIRTSVLAVGASVLEKLLDDLAVGRHVSGRLCSRNHWPCKMVSHGERPKTLRTILGPVRFERTRLVCPRCGWADYPGDRLLSVEGTGFSPGLRRLMTRAGSRESYREAAEDLQVYAGIHVGPKDIERVAEAMGRQIDDWMVRQGSAALLAAATQPPHEDTIPIFYVALDGTGVPMRKSELIHTKGKGEDKKAKTREAKLGCVFTQTTLDDQGNPVRDPDSTSYVGAIESSDDFGNRLYAEAVRRGLLRARKIAALSDGADYIAGVVKEQFPTAAHILDLYHARHRLHDFVRDHTAHPCEGPFHQHCLHLLDEGHIEALTERMRQGLPRRGKRRSEGLKGIPYFAERKEQMRYSHFRRQGFFVGSGVIEAGCKTIIAKRFKQSGMFWTVAGANALIAARCCLYSGRFEQFWEDLSS